MDRLKGKTILIGRESVSERLLVAVSGNEKTAAIGSSGSVPKCVSRYKPAEGVAHAKISIDLSGNMTLTNMQSQNVTFVNGSEILSKRVTTSDTIELGKERFRVNLPMIIETAKNLIPFSKKFNISHLKVVWNDFHDRSLEIKKRQKKQGVYASLPMFFTMGGGAVTFVLSCVLEEQDKEITQILTGILVVIGLILFAVSFVKRCNDSSIEEMERISENFQDRYVCPNPECNKFLGNISYKRLKKQYSMHCPHCKSEFIEK